MHSDAAAVLPLDTFLKPVIGLPAWGVKHGYGSFLTFEFGEPKLEVPKQRAHNRTRRGSAYARGRWHLWIYCCHWRATQDGVQLAWSEDSSELMGRAATQMNGQKLLAVTVEPAQGRSTFTFELGGSLETWPYGDDPTDEQWTILTEAEAFTYRADGFYKLEPSDTPPEEERWLPLR